MAFRVLKTLRSSDPGNDASLVQPAKVNVLSDRTIEESCAYCVEKSENRPFSVCAQSYIFFLGASVVLCMLAKVLHESIYRWIQFIYQKKKKKEKWSVMIIECRDKRAVSIRWANEIDKLMEKI